jgi:hypothetical protein
MNPENDFKLFHVNASLLNTELDEIERSYLIDLGRFPAKQSSQDEAYYPQFTASVRAEAASMATHYELFYCLENSIRELVATQLLSTVGQDWWERAVPDSVKDNVVRNIQREKEAGVTLRSPDLINYTTFGELSDIIQHNWEGFADTFNNKKALAKVLSGLNLLRAPIAHCSPLAADEVLRLELSLRDWFRLME